MKVWQWIDVSELVQHVLDRIDLVFELMVLLSFSGFALLLQVIYAADHKHDAKHQT
jgi:hypothetical protein|tara:strand:- start:894 stop:1061 length:168 start_codon:yes stop_codon:yes gene_type:complete